MTERDEIEAADSEPAEAGAAGEAQKPAKPGKQPAVAASGGRLSFREYRETLQTIVIAVAIAFGIRTFAYEPFNIPSGSMKPTLQVGDYLFVSKFSYGYTHYSFPLSPPIFEGRILGSLPERGDVAVFRRPREEEIDYIKRIVGLPGDYIQVRRGVLHINGEAVKREKVGEERYHDTSGREHRVTEYIETLPGGRRHKIWEESDGELQDNTEGVEIPEGFVFAMGDNRDNSQDSRLIGLVPVENLIGRAEVLFFSHDGSARFWEVWLWPWAIRYSRIFDGIE